MIKPSKPKAYFGISKSQRMHFNKEIEVIEQTLLDYNMSLNVFVDRHQFTSDQEKDMMNIAFKEIDDAEILIVELTNKAISVGVEVGYAKAKNKPIIYLKRKEARH
jgi:nucleoside 2-deoxyribosyltransferase